MKQLHANWIFEGWLDREYKHYLLLDYLQHAKANLGATASTLFWVKWLRGMPNCWHCSRVRPS